MKKNMKTKNITLIKQNKCCGCEACVNSCPQKLISMKSDKAGFLYPVLLDESKCIHCGKCLKSCPVFEKNIPDRIDKRKKELYFWVKDNDNLISCSSGGLATYLYKSFLADGGYIVGVKYAEDIRSANFLLTRDAKNIDSFKGSKYIQAKKNNIYTSIKEALGAGNRVLFVGLPCEVAAMKRMSNSHDLYTCELICHGPTSGKMLSKYIALLEEQKGTKVIGYTSRYKNPNWKPLNSKVTYADGTEHSQLFAATELGKAFQMLKRRSCNNCEYKNGVTAADLTIGDFHAAKEDRGDYNINGVSICFVNTTQGESLIALLSPDEVVMGVANHDAAIANRALQESMPKLPGRQRFIRKMERKGLEAAAKDFIINIVLKYRKYPYRLKLRICRFFKRVSKKISNIFH